jgi:hypothetical protein
MPLPRVRFTVRRMMVAVAIVGIFLGLVSAIESRRWSMRSKEYAATAKFHHDLEEIAKQGITEEGENTSWWRERAKQIRMERRRTGPLAAYEAVALDCDKHAVATIEYAARWRRKASHYAAIALKYEEAANHPWLPVPPDPPEPE